MSSSPTQQMKIGDFLLCRLEEAGVVGPLSAINRVAGFYSEHVPVICISGSIPLRSIDRGLGMHHTMADGSWDPFLSAYAASSMRSRRR